MSELELKTEADDQKLLAQVIDYYRRTLKDSPDAMMTIDGRHLL